MTAALPFLQPKSILNIDVKRQIYWTYWKNLKAFTVPPPLEKRRRKSSSLTSCLFDSDTKRLFSCHMPRHTTPALSFEKGILLGSCGWPAYGMLERWRVAEGGKMFWKFFEPGFLKRCSGELLKSLVRPWSSRPSRGSATVWCLDSVTRIILLYIFCPFRWLMAAERSIFCFATRYLEVS